MELFLLVLIMLGLIGVSNVVNRFVPFIPIPLIQIALGVIIALTPAAEQVELNPELFFVLFIAPLLFNDGKRTPREELWKLRAPILLLALGLVLATVFTVGPFIHWLIPDIPLAAAFALAAILSPTDAVAVGSLAGRIRLPGRIMRLLEGEALMNDASGLVAFKFAIGAAVTGLFSVSEAAVSFVLIAVGGLLMGALTAFLLIWLRVYIRRLGMEDVTVHMLVLIMTPFIIYLIAEEVGVSGILAVVAGGIVSAIERDRSESASAELRIVSENTWSVILFILNGLVFIILGLEIPSVASVIIQDQAYENGRVVGYIFLITVVLLALRFVWVYLFASGRNLHTSLLTALSGVRGAVTLAGAFSIPLIITGGGPFPQRDLIIFLSAGVILLTLVVASGLLPLLSKQPKEDSASGQAASESSVQIQVLEAGLKTLREHITDDNRPAALSIITQYHQQLQWLRNKQHGGIFDIRKKMVELRLQALRTEEKTVRRWLEEGRISGELAQPFQYALKQTELILSNRLKFLVVMVILSISRLFKRQSAASRIGHWSEQDWRQVKEMKIQCINEAVDMVKCGINDKNRDASLSVIAHYREFEEMLRAGKRLSSMSGEIKNQKKDLQIKALQTERNVIQKLYEKGEIDHSMASKLRSFLNYREASVFEQDHM
ncbi:Na+/H+ antiporter [Paenibacillus filicis]|uniref:Na+/H+ antiporter n=1 Tax=Paenibacillus filicis TaxID=669464 RepID=A0ABU9DG64_9BACL